MTRTCIIVASHISKAYRLKYLCECLQSLVEQTVIIPIYLSISFENDLVKNVYHKIMDKNGLLNNNNITIFEIKDKTSQFRHIFNVFEYIKNDFEYVMFCDDDDTYVNNRVELFINGIEGALSVIEKGKKLVGIYEGKNDKTHIDEYKEYWSYCIKTIYIQEFIVKINSGGFDKFVDHNMFDVIFSSYLRFMDNTHVFVSYPLMLYNYRKNTNDSVTANMQNGQHIDDTTSTFNEFLWSKKDSIKNNIFVKNAMGHDYDIKRVLKDAINGRKTPPNLLQNINTKWIIEINDYYKEIRQLVVFMNIYRPT